MQPNPNNLIWIDLEMTGLDTQSDYILEIATIVTDAELNVIATGPELAIHQEDATLAAMDDWNTKHHGRSGLTARVKESPITEAMAEAQTLEFLRQYLPAGKSPMCGNSICQDRRFLAKWMPQLERFFHYRNLDVSTVKELARHWSPQLIRGFKKKSRHLAMEDVIESIEELKFYKRHFLIQGAQLPIAESSSDNR